LAHEHLNIVPVQAHNFSIPDHRDLGRHGIQQYLLFGRY
jgi:hypothetical protein